MELLFKVKEEDVMERWKSFFPLLNKSNEYQLEEEDKVEGPIWGVTQQMVEHYSLVYSYLFYCAGVWGSTYRGRPWFKSPTRTTE